MSKRDYGLHVQVYKDLARVWADEDIRAAFAASSTATGAASREAGSWDQSNTILIDDSVIKAAAQPHNLLRVPEYDAAAVAAEAAREQAGEKSVLMGVRDQLEFARRYTDVSAYFRWKSERDAASNAGLDATAVSEEVEGVIAGTENTW